MRIIILLLMLLHGFCNWSNLPFIPDIFEVVAGSSLLFVQDYEVKKMFRREDVVRLWHQFLQVAYPLPGTSPPVSDPLYEEPREWVWDFEDCNQRFPTEGRLNQHKCHISKQ